MAAKSEKELISESLGKAIQLRLHELGTNPRRLSAKIDKAYDHVRKVCNGEVFPGPSMLKLICSTLDLDYDEMLALVNLDKAVSKGWAPIEVTDEDPLLIKVRRSWEYLTHAEKLEILDTVKFKAERAIKRAGHASHS